MEASTPAFAEVTLPAGTLGELRRALAREGGSLLAIRSLHAAGHAGGAAAAEAFRGSGADPVDSLPADIFWARLSDFFARRGWGSLRHEAVNPAVGTLISSDWAEGLDQEAGEDASCAYSTGFLCGLLSTLAGGPVAVLEISCRGRGDGACTFAFGSAAAIHDLYGRLLEGVDLDRALAAL